jgi:hypothetical protein
LVFAIAGRPDAARAEPSEPAVLATIAATPIARTATRVRVNLNLKIFLPLLPAVVERTESRWVAEPRKGAVYKPLTIDPPLPHCA